MTNTAVTVSNAIVIECCLLEEVIPLDKHCVVLDSLSVKITL